MNSRERVIKALNFEEPDRVPIDWGMCTVSGIHEVAYRNLLKYLGKQEEIIISDPVQRLALPSEDILETFGVDTRLIWANPSSGWKYEEDQEGNWFDENGVYYKRCGYYCDFKGHPLANADSIADLKKFRMSDPTDPQRFAGLREKAKNLYENTDKALVAGSLASLYYVAWSLRGYEDFMADIAADPPFANYILDMITEWYLAFMDCYLKEIGEYVQIMWAGDDWGSQYGPLINPDEFRSNVLPRFKKIITFMKDRSKAKLAYHSCGSVLWCMDDFIEMGVDIIQPLQANAAQMGDSQKIKQQYYKRLALHGGLDNQGKFHTTQEAVIEDAKYRIMSLAPGGGYLYATGHNIQANCPPENIVAIFETIKQFGNYPIKIS